MAEKNVSVRLVATGGGQVRAELTQIGAAGDKAFDQVDAGAKRAGRGLRVVSDAAGDAGKAAGGMGGGMRGASQQLSQVAQQTMATGNFVQALAIQLPDLALGFGPVGAAAGVAAGILLSLAPSLLGVGSAAKEMEEKTDAAEKATQAMVAAVKAADTPLLALQQRYRSLGDAIYNANNVMAAFMTMQAERDVVGMANNLAPGVGFGSDLFLQIPEPAKVTADGAYDYDAARKREILIQRQSQAMDNLREKTGATAQQAELLKEAIADMNKASTVEDVVEDGNRLLSVLFQIHSTADEGQQAFLQTWATSISASMKIAKDQIDAGIAERDRLLSAYDKTGTAMVQLAGDLQSAEAERAKAVAAGLTEEVAKWDKVIGKIKEATAAAWTASEDFTVAFARTGDGFSMMYDRMNGGVAPYAAEMGQDEVAGDAISLLKQFEGFSSKAYWDVNAFRAGFGSDTVTLADGSVRAITEGMSVSLADANRDLNRRVIEFQNVVIKQIGRERWGQFNQAQQASLTSVAYNYGSLPERILDAVRNGTPQDISTAIGRLGSDNKGVNKDRRLKEATAFGDTSFLTRDLAETTRMNTELQRGLDLRADFLASMDQQVAAAALEAESTGKSVYEQTRLRAEMMLTQQARAKGIDLTDKIAGTERTYGQAISETAAALASSAQNQADREGQMKAAEDAAKRAGDTMSKLRDEMQSGFDSAFKSIIDGMKSVEDAFRDMIANMLAERAAAGFGSIVDSVMGAAFGGFGGGDSLSSALAGAGAPVGGAIAQQAVHVTVGVDQKSGNLTAFTDQRVSMGMRQADRAMPGRVDAINRDPLRR